MQLRFYASIYMLSSFIYFTPALLCLGCLHCFEKGTAVKVTCMDVERYVLISSDSSRCDLTESLTAIVGLCLNHCIPMRPRSAFCR